MSSSLDTPSCHCQTLRQAARRVSTLYDAALARFGLRISQYAVLARLEREGPRPIGALADSLAMDRTTLGRALRPLERDGLVQLVRDKADQRQRQLVLTEAGRARLSAARPAWQEAQDRFEAGFGAERATMLKAELASAALAATKTMAAR